MTVMEHIPIGKLLVVTLNADATLKAALGTNVLDATKGAVYRDRAPQDAAHPLVIVSLQSEIPTYAMGATRVMSSQLWGVRAVLNDQSSYGALAICNRVDTLLDNLTSTTTDSVVNLTTWREGAIDYNERIGGQEYRNVGAFYRVNARD